MLISRNKVNIMSQIVLDAPTRRKINKESSEQVTERLRKSMQNSPARKDPEAARKFLAQLSMYDEDGRLNKEF